MPTLSAHSNTENTALVILVNKGYQVWKEGDTYKAEKNGWDFSAGGTTALLGLVAVFEHKRPKRYEEGWEISDEMWGLEDIKTKPKPYAPP